MKKGTSYLFAMIFGVLMMFAIMPLNMEPAYADTAPITVNGVVYTPNADGTTAAVTGRTDALQSAVTIPSSVEGNGTNYLVTNIGKNAFNGCSSLESITIPSSMTSIGEYAFKDSGLKTVEFASGSTLNSIEKHAFHGCRSLGSITIPASVSMIGEEAFVLSGLTTVEFAKGSKLESIGPSTFSAASSLSAITIPESVQSIGEYAFSECSILTAITIPSGVTSIGEGAFVSSGLTTVEFAKGSKLESIGEYAFYKCTKLEPL